MTQTIFTKVDYSLAGLMDAIQLGAIGLPDIQRPFVWKNAKVRDLFHSMYQGYPVGYFLFWENGGAEGVRAIGTETKQKVPQLLIVDGQQRLTSLFAVMRGVPVVRENYQSETIEIAFNPLEQRFEVADAAISKDKSFIPNISSLWTAGADLFEIADSYVEALESVRELTSEEKRAARKSLSKLQNLSSYPFTVLSLAASVDEEQVSDVFVRINSAGKTLNQADFILTLMSVFWDEGRTQLEKFCRAARQPGKSGPSPYNHFIDPSPDQLLRVSVGVGFRKGRLKSVYSVLRGKDLATDEFSGEKREEQFAILKEAQAKALNLQHWHDFLKCLHAAGFRSGRMITSNNNLLFAYMLFLLGKTEMRVEPILLRRLIAQWFFMTAITGRFANTPESRMDLDFAKLRVVSEPVGFEEFIQGLCVATLTGDYWDITLPNDLATSSARSPSLFAYFAALNLLEATALFSHSKVSDLMDPTTLAPKSPLERHHLFPKSYLQSIGVTSNTEINQIANFTVIEWSTNIGISNKAPHDYLALMASKFSSDQLIRMYHWHALPDGWQELPYQEFLRQRRSLMASIIKEAYTKLAGAPTQRAESELPIDELIAEGETNVIEFKSTLRTNLHTGEKDPRMELAVLKTIAAFLNSHGGTLVIGVADDGEPLGLEADAFPNEDKMSLHLINLLNARLGHHHGIYIHPHFEDYEDSRVLTVKCSPAKSPVYVKDGSVERFFVRNGPATAELSASQMSMYIRQRFSV